METNQKRETAFVPAHLPSVVIEDRSRAGAFTGRSRSRWPIVLCAVASLALSACPANLQDPERFEGTPDPNDAPACVTAAFKTSCNSSICHAPNSSTNHLDLISPGVASRIVNKPATFSGLDATMSAMCPPTKPNLIDTANPSASWILIKLGATQNGCGATMPLTGQWTDDEKSCLNNWIQQLASPNGGAGGSSAGGGGGSGGAVAGSGGASGTTAGGAGASSGGAGGSSGSSTGGNSGAAGTSAGGTSAGGMNAGGTSAGGTSAGGMSAGGMSGGAGTAGSGGM